MSVRFGLGQNEAAGWGWKGAVNILVARKRGDLVELSAASPRTHRIIERKEPGPQIRSGDGCGSMVSPKSPLREI